MTQVHHQSPAIVLLSGGLDSAVALAIARSQGFACHAISFDYGQRHRIELQAAARVGEHLGVASHRWVTLDLRAFGGSALTGDFAVPKDRDEAAMSGMSGMSGTSAGIPITYVPARNTIFLAYALAFAEVAGSSDLYIGVNAIDYSGYPDCRPQYIAAFEVMANLATRAGVEGRTLTIHTPLIDWSKKRIIEEGLKRGVDFALTHSCYDPSPTGKPCAHCDACLLRQRAFEELGLRDPVL